MMLQDLRLIDKTISIVREKEDCQSYFSLDSLHKFEFRLFLCMDIVRFELQTFAKISNLTADAINQLFAFGAFEFYYRDFPEVYKKCSELFNVLVNYNERLKNHDLLSTIGFEDESWIEYYNKSISNLIFYLTNKK